MSIQELASMFKAGFEARYDNEDYLRFCSKRKIKLATPCIHIVGTNGKASVGKLLSDIYIAGGYKVGLLLPSFLDSPCEMIRVNGIPISESDFASLYQKHEKDFKKADLTPFESIVVIAYEYFESSSLDLAVICAGMGGGIDATNIEEMDQRLVILTNIGLDHTEYLGTTLSQIGLNKISLLREKTPLLHGALDEGCKKVILDFTEGLESPNIEVDAYHYQHIAEGVFRFDYRPFKDLAVNSMAEAMVYNASLAIEATKILDKSFPVSEEAIRKGLMEKPLPLHYEVHGNLIFDSANNVDAISSVVKALPTLSMRRPVHVVFGAKRSKNVAAMLPPLGNYGCDIHLSTFDSPLAKTEEDYFIFLGDHEYSENAVELVKTLQNTYPDDAILVIGDPELAYQTKRDLGL